MADLRRLAQTMCSMDLVESNWTQELPRLPVPDLWLTVSRYLASLRAVLAPEPAGSGSGAEQESRWRQLERTDRLVKEFMLTAGPQLQRDLKEYASRCQNWATEYWLRDMYLSNPLPLPVNSNPFFLFPRQRFASSHEMLMFATRMIQFSVNFKFCIDRQTLKQDFGSGHGKGKPLCMATYKNFFHSYRMPHEDVDRLLPQSRRSNHIVVASCNQFYILRLGQDPLDNPYSCESSSLMNEGAVYEQLQRIYRISRESARRELARPQSGSRSRPNTPKVGLFTTENRKTWANLHKRLSHCTGADDCGAPLASAGSQPANAGSGSSSPTSNAESLRLIEDCLFVMCLDSLVLEAGSEQGRQAGQLSEVEAANVILTGGGTHLFTANRWFDKFLQIIVGRDGTCGINIEHSASEGITVTRFLEDFLAFLRDRPVEASRKPHKLTSNGDQPTGSSFTAPGYEEPKSPSALLGETDKITPLVWQLDERLWEACDQAELRVNQLVENFSLHILTFEHFGRDFIKDQNLSPDAFVQLALQYTFYKLHNQLVSTYESASLRQFRLGRVDNIRANTCEAYVWIQAMLASKRRAGDQAQQQGTQQAGVDWRPAERAFIEAITKQVEILRYTIIGGGPDNHLLALKELARIRYDHDELPELFTDPSYKEFLNFRLSTSQLPNDSGITVGYGAVVPDGYGCSYNPCAKLMVFCISSFRDCPITSSSRFGATLTESLLEMQQLCLARGA